MTEVRGGEGTRGPCHRAEIARVVLTRDETTAARDPHLRGEGGRRLLLHIPPPSPSSSTERINVGGGGGVVAVVIATVGDQWCLRVDEEWWWRAVIVVASGRVVRTIVVVRHHRCRLLHQLVDVAIVRRHSFVFSGTQRATRDRQRFTQLLTTRRTRGASR